MIDKETLLAFLRYQADPDHRVYVKTKREQAAKDAVYEKLNMIIDEIEYGLCDVKNPEPISMFLKWMEIRERTFCYKEKFYKKIKKEIENFIEDQHEKDVKND